MKIYHYPNCSSCRKAIKFVDAAGLNAELIDISVQAPSLAELKVMLTSYDGNLRKLFNTSGQMYRQMGLKDTLATMPEQEALTLLADNGMLVKRPFLLTPSGEGRVGFKLEEWQALL